MKNVKKYILAGVIAITALDMAGCTPGNNVPGSTAAGGIAGGLIGGAASGGNVYGIIGGALLGGIIGNQVGQYMDRQDKINMQSAIINTPVNREATWTSDKAGPNGTPVTYTVKPIKNYHSPSHQYCREYQTTVTVAGKDQKAYGKACRQPDGSWKINN
ncbi:MAG: glycine zipper domain-containing protein [Gammaproteobacteria bacterium]|nr:glycine zipper domain-containing protein [Gammaproteobacteria bacterium]